MKNSIINFFVVILLLCSAGHSQARPMYVPPMPEDMEQTDFYLLTVGLGDELYTRFGHTVLRVVDRKAEADYNFNWGMFDYDEPGFAVKFFRGVLMYRIGLSTFPQTISMYRDWEKRRVWQDKLILSSTQKRTLMSRIIWNTQPENIRYPYQYFYNNCATFVRDYIDEAIGGKIAAAYKEAPAQPHTVYRDYVRRNLGENAFVGVGLDVLMNADIDRVMTKWDEMFLPDKLREHLLSLPAVMDDGTPNTASMLLVPDQVLVDLPDKPRDATDARGGFAMMLLLGFLPFIPVLFFLSKRSSPDLKMSKRAFRSLGVAYLFWGLIAGAFGTTMVVSWALSAHTDLHHNANLLLFWPVDWLYLAAGFLMIKRGAGLDLDRPVWKALKYISHFHFVSALIMVLLYVFGGIKQDVSNILTYMIPGYVLVFTVLFVPRMIKLQKAGKSLNGS